MINTSGLIAWTDKGTTHRAIEILKDLERTSAINAKYSGKAVDEVTSRQLRSRISLCILMQKTNVEQFIKATFDTLYTITTTSKTDTQYLKQLYEKVTGAPPAYLEDVEGLRSPLRAMFAILWSEGALTLPHTFSLDGAWQKFPELKETSQGFIHSLTANSPSLFKSARAFQYRTTWHTVADISFSDLWKAAPKVIDIQKELRDSGTIKSLDFSYLAFINVVSVVYPDTVSPDQYFHLEKYHQYLQQKPRVSTALENQQSYEAFREMWGVNSESWENMTPKEREHLRYEKRTHHLHVSYQLAKQQADAEARKAFIADAQQNSTPEELATIIRKSVIRKAKGFTWLVNGAYPGLENVNLDYLSTHWKAAIELLSKHLDKKKIFGRTRNTYYSEVALLMDYIFCYLPIWKQQNKKSLIEIPRLLTDFYRTIFWNDDYVNDEDIYAYDEKDTLSEDNLHTLKNKNLPLTAIKFYLLCFSRKTAASFVSTIHLLFELSAAQGTDIYIGDEALNDGTLVNPIFPRLDSPGSGGRTKTDKVVLPLASVPVAKEYMLAIDNIGTMIRTKILDGEISADLQNKIRLDDWIDLKEVGVAYSIKLINPSTRAIVHEIPLQKIANVYHWHHSRYSSGLSWVPWLSATRMLTIAMYGGLRLQNCQWLDIRTFDRFYHPGKTVLGYTTLYVNTDKNGDSRPISLPTEVFDCLLDERKFQHSWTRRPVGPVHYENNPDDDKYGAIYPLFRSPFSKNGLPFSDNAYASMWVKVLNGIESVYNSIVPDERRHSFTTVNAKGASIAVHTPHSLRATWITYMSIYGHLPHAILGHQVAHANPKTSVYYTAPTLQQIEEHVRAAEAKAQQASYDSLWSVQLSPTAQNGLMASWQADASEAAKAYGLVSLSSPVIETQQTGLSLLKIKDVTDIGWYPICACMVNGKCPKELLKFTTCAKTCGMCPHAVFGVSHLPAINAKMRALIDECEALQEQVSAISAAQPASQTTQDLHHLLTVSKLELAGFEQVRQILNKHMESENYRIKYISRHGGFINHSLEFDDQDPVQRFLANIIDGREFPAFAAKNYLIRLKKIASQPHLLSIALSSPEKKEIIANQIIFMLDNTGITIPELAQRMQEPGFISIGLEA
ncbi:hypothetical protein [Pseudomonas sp. MH10]|uniref:hypothetical protein n=1 Tax=Pseudomonas sp. MH10 TaxID=3048627 RepID=UPI002AC9195D|nr:hypothetical protein [Pseudomonas sp. MH10]MEB0043591.1 hypothetical protein [Pseudomonas sp. MH10]WPX63593.1 hypothetical protein RHM59_22400 [Pseudomonas sp. MH10]